MSLCECGCGGEAKPGRRFIKGHQRRGIHHTEQTKQKMRENRKINKEIREGKRPAPKLPFCVCGCGGRVAKLGNKYINGHGQRGDNNPAKLPGVGEKISKAKKGKKRPDMLGDNNPMRLPEIKELFLGDNNPAKLPGVGEKISKAKKGKCTGEKASNWQGGVSFEPYCYKFNGELKERVREFFGRKCLLCGTLEGDEKLSVHHVNYDKMVCCNDVKPLFAPLCRKCHGKTVSKRKYYEEYFTQKIIEEYGGKCFLTKEEMENEGL